MGTEDRDAARRKLSAEELAVLQGIARGDDFNTIARKLSLAPATIAYHATKLRRLLNAPNLPALVAIAFVIGLLTNDVVGLDFLLDLSE
ncbi:LuxR C-terminal-related transcriptional regulator [Curtobacterium sp. 1P10AnD]|uniref:LuxR C-terminal-related transcriptional regulator n=1 Tax=unclassified Curtobacterium TaxID=257496 RepID=UPI0025B3B50B|nr:LuxR C-terminal-related transcriptional regulator [Curtobacterium sp. 458]WJY00395.1 LuxR C-terminal-related transcriptional regulator [Curtobacterium sp. 458]